MKLEDALGAKGSGSSPAAYRAAAQQFAALGVDADAAIRTALATPISAHCWQADDVGGLEVHEGGIDSGGLKATGNFPGAARTGDEIRADFDFASALMPGALRFNLHAMYAEAGKPVPRDELLPEHFRAWLDWAAARKLPLDFNPTFFAHPLAADGMTLSHPKKAVREFWVRHGRVSRDIAAAFGRKLGACVCNIWIPDGIKDSTADRRGPRARLADALDAVLEAPRPKCIDTVESKLFGLGYEDYTVGSHEFYLLYAQSRKVGLCLDMGHFHPTEGVADKISSIALFVRPILLHVSRGIRWDSDHVVRLNDDLRAVCDEAVRSGALRHVLWATDYFDASLNRVAAWVIGIRAVRKALLYALLEPWKLAVEAEAVGDNAAKLAVEEARAELPFGAVWDEACRRADVPAGLAWMADVRRYEAQVLAARG
jgi:L-rhamnose isomerase